MSGERVELPTVDALIGDLGEKACRAGALKIQNAAIGNDRLGQEYDAALRDWLDAEKKMAAAILALTPPPTAPIIQPEEPEV